MNSYAEWLAYYSEIRQFRERVAERFFTLLTQQIIGVSAAATVFITIHDKFSSQPYIAFFIALPLLFGISIYGWMMYKCRKQAGRLCKLMADIEKDKLFANTPDVNTYGLKTICGDREFAIFHREATGVAAIVFTAILGVCLIAVVVWTLAY